MSINSADLLDNVVQFGFSATNDYLRMSDDKNASVVPESWIQSEIARLCWLKYDVPVCLEPTIHDIFYWAGRKNFHNEINNLERFGGRVDVGIFGKGENNGHLTAIIELKRVIWNGLDCIDDIKRILLLRKKLNREPSDLYGVVAGVVWNNGNPIDGIYRESISNNLKGEMGGNAERALYKEADNKLYGFMAALIQ